MTVQNHPFSLEDRRVLIVGASSGIGLAAARMVDNLGGVPILASRSSQSLERSRVSLPRPERATIVAFDYLDAIATQNALNSVGRIDHLMITAVADENRKRGAFEGLDRATMNESFDKFWGQINVLKAALPNMAEDGSATLFASVAGIKPTGPDSGLSVMNAVQAGVIQLARSLALELAPRRINVMAPGVVLTNVWSAEQREDLARWMQTTLPVRRAGEPEHVAMAALSLMVNPYITGVVLPVDGGMLLS